MTGPPPTPPPSPAKKGTGTQLWRAWEAGKAEGVLFLLRPHCARGGDKPLCPELSQGQQRLAGWAGHWQRPARPAPHPCSLGISPTCTHITYMPPCRVSLTWSPERNPKWTRADRLTFDNCPLSPGSWRRRRNVCKHTHTCTHAHVHSHTCTRM